MWFLCVLILQHCQKNTKERSIKLLFSKRKSIIIVNSYYWYQKNNYGFWSSIRSGDFVQKNKRLNTVHMILSMYDIRHSELGCFDALNKLQNSSTRYNNKQTYDDYKKQLSIIYQKLVYLQNRNL